KATGLRSGIPEYGGWATVAHLSVSVPELPPGQPGEGRDPCLLSARDDRLKRERCSREAGGGRPSGPPCCRWRSLLERPPPPRRAGLRTTWTLRSRPIPIPTTWSR